MIYQLWCYIICLADVTKQSNQNKLLEEVLDAGHLWTNAHMKEDCLRAQFSVQCMRSSYLYPFMYHLCKGYSQETIVFTSSSVDGFYTEL
jgi:hypothetical protein